jgi:hypothetical protein
LDKAEYLNLPRRETVKLLWRALKKHGLSDDYVKFVLLQLYKHL